MNLLTRLCLTLVVVTFAAGPVIDCCLLGHAEASVAVSQTDAPPCHGAADDASQPQPSPQEHSECPGCTDCDAPMLQATAMDNAVAPASGHELQPAPVAARQWSGFDTPLVVRTTGPPSSSPPIRTSPISLKQRLLI